MFHKLNKPPCKVGTKYPVDNLTNILYTLRQSKQNLLIHFTVYYPIPVFRNGSTGAFDRQTDGLCRPCFRLVAAAVLQPVPEYPVFLFDDVLSERDRDRQRDLLQKLEERQVILTSCNRELFEGMHAPMIRVEEGTYEREEQG